MKSEIKAMVQEAIERIATRKVKINNSPELGKNIFYFNGTHTGIKKATRNLTIINQYFKDIDCKLVFANSRGFFNIGADRRILNRLHVKLDESFDGNPISDIIDIPTLRLLGYIQTCKNRDIPMGIIGSSYGTLATYVAILGFYLLNKNNKRYLKEKVRVCHVAPVFKDNYFEFLADKLNAYQYCINNHDVASRVLMGKKVKDNLGIPGRKHGIGYYLVHKTNDKVAKHLKEEYERKVIPSEQEPYVKKDFFTAKKPIIIPEYNG